MPLQKQLALVSAAVLFSTGAAGLKALSLDPVSRACFRSGIAAAFLFLVLPRARRIPSLLTLGLAAVFAASTSCTVIAVSSTTAAAALFLMAASPLFVLLGGILLLGERPRRSDLAPVLLLASGFAVVWSGQPAAQDSAPDPGRGLVFASIGSVAWAGVVLGLRRAASRRCAATDPSQQVLVFGNAMACLVTGLVAAPPALPTTADWWILAYLGVVQIGVAYALLARGLREVPAFQASLLLLLEPVLAPVWALLVHGEQPRGATLVGGVLAVCGSAAFAFGRRESPTA